MTRIWLAVGVFAALLVTQAILSPDIDLSGDALYARTLTTQPRPTAAPPFGAAMSSVLTSVSGPVPTSATSSGAVYYTVTGTGSNSTWVAVTGTVE